MSFVVKFEMSLPAIIEKKENWFVSICPVLDIMSQGNTKKEALDNLIDATEVFLYSCHERGTLDAVLKECGFKLSTKKIPLKEQSAKTDSYHINLPFIIDDPVYNSCHA